MFSRQFVCLFLLVTSTLLGGCGPAPSAAPPEPAPQPPPAAAASVPPAAEPAVAEPPVAQTLPLASTPWPPFTDEEGSPRVAIDLVHTALSRAGYAATTNIVGQGMLTEALEQGTYVGSVALWRSAEREAFLLYSDAYLENRMVLVGRAGSDVRARSLKELRGKRVGIVEGYAYGPELEAAKEPKFVSGRSDELNLRALLEKKLDYVIADSLLMAHVFEQFPHQASERLVVAPSPLITRSLHFALRKDVPNAAVIVARFNEEIRLMLADGSYNRALGLAWVSADVDGDGRAELVPRTNQVGARPPAGGYNVLSVPAAPASSAPTQEPQRYYVGGKHYESWEVVPDDRKREPDDDKFIKQFSFTAFDW
ncbi:MAG TPA: transporter substrate-binding domain-containing protein [Polyangiaceae bacterium]|nr:transporter substrate-binding domain-containing protein [Polyangiaceae bacterium]